MKKNLLRTTWAPTTTFLLPSHHVVISGWLWGMLRYPLSRWLVWVIGINLWDITFYGVFGNQNHPSHCHPLCCCTCSVDLSSCWFILGCSSLNRLIQYICTAAGPGAFHGLILLSTLLELFGVILISYCHFKSLKVSIVDLIHSAELRRSCTVLRIPFQDGVGSSGSGAGTFTFPLFSLSA